MATTIKQLIEQLKQFDDQDQPVIYAVFTRSDFEFDDDGEAPVTPEVFKAVAEWHDNINFSLWEDAAETLNNKVWVTAREHQDKLEEAAE